MKNVQDYLQAFFLNKWLQKKKKKNKILTKFFAYFYLPSNHSTRSSLPHGHTNLHSKNSGQCNIHSAIGQPPNLIHIHIPRETMTPPITRKISARASYFPKQCQRRRTMALSGPFFHILLLLPPLHFTAAHNAYSIVRERKKAAKFYWEWILSLLARGSLCFVGRRRGGEMWFLSVYMCFFWGGGGKVIF